MHKAGKLVCGRLGHTWTLGRAEAYPSAVKKEMNIEVEAHCSCLSLCIGLKGIPAEIPMAIHVQRIQLRSELARNYWS